MHGRRPRVVLLDWTTRQAEQIGRKGEGPGEYTSVNRIWALPGDSTIISDHHRGRWVMLRGTTFGDAIAPFERWRLPAGEFAGLSDDGGVLQLRYYSFGSSPRIPRALPMPPNAESLLVVRFSRGRGDPDTIAKLRGPFLGMRQAVKGGVPTFYGNPVAVGDQALLFPDGWIALAIAQPYRVDWVTPDGRRLRGPPLPFDAVAMDAVQKQAALEHAHPRKASEYTVDEMPGWPATLPPFTTGALLAAADGHVVIRRMPDARIAAAVYDEVDRSGRLARRIVLQPDERLVGVSARWAYVVGADDDDIQHVRRYVWR